MGLPFCLLAGAASRPRPARVLGAGKGHVLRIYNVVLEVLGQLQPVLRRIELRDKDLARQLRRCSSSVALNLIHCSGGRSRTATENPYSMKPRWRAMARDDVLVLSVRYCGIRPASRAR